MPAPSRSRPGDVLPGPDPVPLAAPFGVGDLAWTVVEVADARDEVRVVPRPAERALRARLDAVAGVRGWGVRFDRMPEDAVACHLEIDGLTKGVVAPAALVGGGAETAAIAFAGAAALWGARPAWPDGASVWVACDPETLAPLETPTAPPPAAEASTAAAPPAADAEDADEAVPWATADAATPVAAPAPAEPAQPVAEAAAPKPEAQQLIDRLIERLKGQGQGLAAARVLVKHGGYGRDPQAARELYTELRQLLLAGSAAEATP